MSKDPAATALSPLEANGWYWKEAQYSNDDVIPAKVPADFLVTFRDGEQFSVTTDCNNGAGSYKTEDTSLTFGPIAATKKACLAETQEAVFFLC